jgi:N-acetylmuramoyl-L-alanine amidase
MQTLKRGSKGEDVKYFQYLAVTQYGQKISIDGDFGPATETAGKNIQAQLGYTGKDIDGSIGPDTQKRMGISDFKIFLYPKEYYDIWFAGKPYNQSTPNPTKTLKQWATEEGADYAFNLAFFVMDDKGVTKDQYGYVKGRTLQDIRGKGKDIGYGAKTSERVVIDTNNFCCGWTVAIKDGKLLKKAGGSNTAQNANGFLKDGTYFQVQSITTSTEYAMTKWVNDNYDVDLMLMQDGGGSVSYFDASLNVLLAPLKKTLTNGRPVATAVCIKKKAGYVKPPEVTPPKKKKVCIDAGHGVEEAGKQSPDGLYREHEFTLAMSKKMEKILTAHGVEVIQTRKDEHQLGPTGSKASNYDLPKRVAIANSIKDLDLIVSLHSNAAPGEGWSSAIGYTVFTSVANEKAERNILANKVIARAREANITLRNPPLKHGLFYILRYTTAPAILIEHGFHTNKEEVILLKADSYRDRLAEINCKGILDYLGITWQGTEDSTWKQLRGAVQKKYNFDENTMSYLDGHPHAEALYIRLVEN